MEPDCTSSDPMAGQLAERRSVRVNIGPDSAITSRAPPASDAWSSDEAETVAQMVTRRQRLDMFARALQAKIWRKPCVVQRSGFSDGGELYVYPTRPPGWTQPLE